MTCKDCLHFEVCDSGRHIGEHIDGDGIYSDSVEKECTTFKNKTDFVKVKRGEWLPNEMQIENNTYFDGFRFCGTQRLEPINYRCSLCGRIERFQEPYCNCGAKMDGRGD